MKLTQTQIPASGSSFFGNSYESLDFLFIFIFQVQATVLITSLRAWVAANRKIPHFIQRYMDQVGTRLKVYLG